MRVQRAIDLPRLRVRYITGTESLAEIARGEGIGADTLRRRAKEGEWEKHRAEWQEEQAAKDLATEEEAREKRRKQALTIVHTAKVIHARKLIERLKHPQFVPTVQELVMLQKLENDLDGRNDDAPKVSVSVSIESVMERVREERRQIVDAEVTSVGPSDDVSSFMLGDGDDDED